MYYFGTVNNKLSGRSTHFFKEKENATEKVNEQNERAEAMGLKVIYTICSCDYDDKPDNEVAR